MRHSIINVGRGYGMALATLVAHAGLTLGIAASLGVAADTAAQTAPGTGSLSLVQPYYAVVTQEATPMRSGPSQNFYSVGTLANQTIVAVDGESNGWLRVLYPVGTEAFVRAEDVKMADTRLELTRASQLRAINQTQGFNWSWKMLTDAPLPEGTTLTSIEPVKEGEVIVGYKVVAPPQARGFIASQRLRRATESEVSAALASGKALPALPTFTASTTPAAPAGETGANGQVVPLNITQGASGQTIDISATAQQQGTTQQGIVTVLREGTQTQDVSQASAGISPEQLETVFQRVWREPVQTSELDELIAQYERAIAALPAGQERRRAALDQRVQALQVRRQLRETIRQQESQQASLQQQQVVVERELEQAAAGRVYTLVGVLQPSTVYDGQRLPLMYRIVSVGGGSSPRTLGYIKAGEGMDLNRYLGQIVGVIGDSALDRALMLNVITPVRVDPLRSVPGATVPAASTPASIPSSDTAPAPSPAPAPAMDPTTLLPDTTSPRGN